MRNNVLFQHFLRQWFVLILVLVSVTSCELEQYGTSTALPKPNCKPGEYEYKGQCVPAGLPPDMPCPPGETLLDDGRCQPAGLPLDMQCPPGELALENGKCQPAGVPPEMCGEGFEPDGKMGCNAILPKEPCPFGLMAVPGETECHEVAPCGEGTWGDIPVDETTQFVNQAYAGNDSDGSKERPWKTIANGIWKADPGAIVAIAEGTYEENLLIEKQVKLWGVCPKKVTVVGVNADGATIEVSGNHADGTEFHNIAITGAARGLRIYGTRQLVIDRIWIHDTKHIGMVVWNKERQARITIAESLIEGTHRFGIVTIGAEVGVINNVIRDIHVVKGEARAIDAIEDEATNTASQVSVHGCLFEKLVDGGVRVLASNAKIEATAVRDVHGWGIGIIANGANGIPSNATISQITVERATEAGILVWDSTANIALSTVRGDTASPLPHDRGIIFQGLSGYSTGKILASTIDGPGSDGVLVFNSDAEIEGCLIENVRSADPMANEAGIFVSSDSPTSSGAALIHWSKVAVRGTIVEKNDRAGVYLESSTVTIRDSVLQKNAGAGVSASGANLTLEMSIVRETQPQPQGLGAHGLGVELAPSRKLGERTIAIIRASVIEQNQFRGIQSHNSQATFDGVRIDSNKEMGIFSTASELDIKACIIRDTGTSADGASGWGIGLQNDFEDNFPHSKSNARILNSIVEENQEVGIMIFGSDALIEATMIQGTQCFTDDSGREAGIQIQTDNKGERSAAIIRNSVVNDNCAVGVSIGGSDAHVESTLISTITSDVLGNYGDGIMVYSEDQLANAVISNIRIEYNDRAGIANIGGNVELFSSALACNAFEMSTRSYKGHPGEFSDQGGNHCGCPDATGACIMTNLVLKPPPPLPPRTTEPQTP